MYIGLTLTVPRFRDLIGQYLRLNLHFKVLYMATHLVNSNWKPMLFQIILTITPRNNFVLILNMLYLFLGAKGLPQKKEDLVRVTWPIPKPFIVSAKLQWPVQGYAFHKKWQPGEYLNPTSGRLQNLGVTSLQFVFSTNFSWAASGRPSFLRAKKWKESETGRSLNFSSFYISHKAPFTVDKGNKGRYNESTIRGHGKNLSPRWYSNLRPSLF